MTKPCDNGNNPACILEPGGVCLGPIFWGPGHFGPGDLGRMPAMARAHCPWQERMETVTQRDKENRE